MDKKRILFLHNEFPSGGADRVTIDIAGYISHYGFEVYVLAREIRDKFLSNIVLLELPDKASVNSKENADAIIETLKQLRIDIFVLPVQTLSHLAHIRNNTNCKIIFALHSVPFWEIGHDLYNKKKKAWHSLSGRIKWILFTYPKTVWFKKYYKRLLGDYRRIYELVDVYTVLCEGYKQTLIDKIGLSPEENKISVIPNSEKRVENINPNKKKQILFVGRMTYEDKRIDRLIDIWELIYREVPDWELILVGDGDEKVLLQQRAQRKRLQRISFVGYSSCVDKYYYNASVLCLTSNYEGWPLCLTEAQANGVVPVAFDCVAGIHEIISPSGENGILVPPFSLKEYARLLIDLLNDADKLQKMKGNVIRKSMDYAPEVIGEKWLRLFESLLLSSKKEWN